MLMFDNRDYRFLFTALAGAVIGLQKLQQFAFKLCLIVEHKPKISTGISLNNPLKRFNYKQLTGCHSMSYRNLAGMVWCLLLNSLSVI